MVSFEAQMRNKRSYMFQSQTQRHPAESASLSPGPTAYTKDVSSMLKRDFSRPRAVFASPTRNTDGALTKAGISPHMQAVSCEVDAQFEPGPAPRKMTERSSGMRLKQYGINMITNTLVDPDMLKINNEVAKA